MAKKLNDTPDGLLEAFEHQLCYEVNMLWHTYNFLHDPKLANVIANKELENAVIESFCVHARNLIDFFDENSATPSETSKDSIGANHFCDGYKKWKSGGPSNDLRARLNNQIVHLTYARTSKDDEKIGPKERKELIGLIERELGLFRRCLKPPYKGPLDSSCPSSSPSKTGMTGTAAPTVPIKIAAP